MPAVKVDGLDFFAVHEAAREAIDRARRGEGPSAIEAVATRFYGHFEGDPMLYRAKEEIEKARAEQDCLQIFRAGVQGKIDEAELDAIDAEVQEQVDEAVAAARAAAYPAVENVTTDVYINY
jgi:pyruvate dehydrogenase E1 component alpha subunit